MAKMKKSKLKYTKPTFTTEKKLDKKTRRVYRHDRLKQKNKEKLVNFELRNARKQSVKTVFSIFGIVLLILFGVALLRKFTGNTELPTFQSFLEMLVNIETPLIPFLSFSNGTLGDWGWFDFLRVFLELIMQIVNVIIFFVNGIISLIGYIVYFIGWIFG